MDALTVDEVRSALLDSIAKTKASGVAVTPHGVYTQCGSGTCSCHYTYAPLCALGAVLFANGIKSIDDLRARWGCNDPHRAAAELLDVEQAITRHIEAGFEGWDDSFYADAENPYYKLGIELRSVATSS